MRKPTKCRADTLREMLIFGEWYATVLQSVASTLNGGPEQGLGSKAPP